MNKNFEIGKVVIHDSMGTSVYRNVDDALRYLSAMPTEAKTDKVSEKPRKLLDIDYAELEPRIVAMYPELRKRLESALDDLCTHDDARTDPYTYGDPLEPITRLSEDLKLYEGVGTNGDSGQRDPVNIGYANINVSIEGDKWFAKDLLSVLEATILDTIREYKEFNSGARSLKTSVSTSTQSTQ